MSLFPLDKFLRRLVTHGELTVIGANGERQTFGRPGTGPAATLRITDPTLIRRFLRRPNLVIGEAYMDGSFVIEEGTLRDAFEIIVASSKGREPGGLSISLMKLGSLFHRNDGARAARNVQHHYDIDHTLYELFLDEDMQYSCAYWRDGVTSLEQAQRDKKDHIARKLLLEPGMKVLDIGCGWGGMALHLAREYDVEVTGVTLSRDQHETSVRRAEAEGLSDKVTFKLLDYRSETGTFDRVVSVGMFEHVGRRNYPEFFRHLHRLLKPEGVALIHTIGRQAPPAPINAWMQKYIFPGAYLPSLSQLSPILENQDLWLTDFEMLRMHYAMTLAAWDERFQARRAEIAERFDERFCRMWEFYLQLCEVAFRHRSLVVFQMQIAKRNDTVPLTRDYIYPARSSADAVSGSGTNTASGTEASAKPEKRKKTAASRKPARAGRKPATQTEPAE